MAKYLKLDLDQYGVGNTIPLVAGDDWVLEGKIFNLNGKNHEEVDLTGFTGATGYFPPDVNGNTIIGNITVIDALVAKVSISLPASASINAGLNDTGLSTFITITDENNLLSTIPTIDQPLTISARGFTDL
jgi:hypothetical protein